MTNNMKDFLEKVSKNAELAKRAEKMDAEELKALAQELGMELTDDDMELNCDVNDAELEAVAGGYCSLAGGNSCTCSAAGYGKSMVKKFCLCTQGGTGTTFGPELERGGAVLCQCAMCGTGGSD